MAKIPKPLQDPRIKFIKLSNDTKLPIEQGWQLCEKDWIRLDDKSWKSKQDNRIHFTKNKITKKQDIYYGEKHNYKYNDKVIQKWIEKGNSYGVLCGLASNGLIVLDADKPVLVEYINKNLPNTFKEHKDAHVYFWCPEITKEEGLNKDSIHYGEIKSTGRQVKVYDDNNGQDIIEISRIELRDKLIDYICSNKDFERNVENNPKPKLLFKDSVPCMAVQNMINNGAPTDYRNPTANKIVQQLRGYCGYSKERCLESLKIFNSNCKPPKPIETIESDLDNQFDKYGYKTMNCKTYIDFCPFKDNMTKCPKSIILMDEANKNIENSSIVVDLPEDVIDIDKIYDKEEVKTPLRQPHMGKLISSFSTEIAEVLKDKNVLFYRPDSKDIVEIMRLKIHQTGKETYIGFSNIQSSRFITLVERYIIPGFDIYDAHIKSINFQKKSISSQLSTTLISSHILQQALPQITRIFTIPIPILHGSKLTFPKKGFDERFSSWLPFNAPEIVKPDMSLEESKKIIYDIFKEFCFQSKQDYINAISALLTPFLRGLYPYFNTRSPVFFYLANRERAGKDYLAGITGLIYEGHALEESPISTSEKNNTDTNDELRKKILAAMINGRKRLHFSNNKGYINNAVFEGIITAKTWSDRLLGKNDMLTFDNELDFSLSGNMGVGFTPDLANRCRFIRLFLEIEDANKRKFENPDLHKKILENRESILSALYSLVKHWIDNGSKKGTKAFSSFPEWAEICGGVLENAGYDSPCEVDENVVSFGGDTNTTDMKTLFELCFKKYPDKWINKKIIKEVVIQDNELFSYFDFENRKDQTKFGLILKSFIGRMLSNIRFTIKDIKVQSTYQEFKFTKNKIEKNKDDVFN